MRILDRYAIRQLVPVWIWCLLVFLFLSCLIDLFERLSDIIRYRIPPGAVLQYYLNFVPLVFLRASPLALLLGTAFVSARLARHQELLAMHATGTSLLRASVPFLFVGWLVSLCAFFVADGLVPRASATYERLRLETFRGREASQQFENVAAMDALNRLYHARALDLAHKELSQLTVLEHDPDNRPVTSLYASRAVWTRHGWLLLHGTLYHIGPGGAVRGDPQPFVERLVGYPVTPQSFSQPQTRPESMRYSELRLMIVRLGRMGITNVRRYRVELISKLTLPLMNLIIGFIAFAGSTRPHLRGQLRGMGLTLGWGLAYYFAVGLAEGLAKKGGLFLPMTAVVWTPHVAAVWWCLRVLRRVA